MITLQWDFSRYTLFYMDNHPIPQDVTNFQFKLIGDLTLKQFGYLIASIVFAWLFFLLPIFVIIKLPLSISILGIGVILAFVPFEGRPSDIMFFHFFKALFTPNQYTYQSGNTLQAHVDNQPKEKVEEQKKEVTKSVMLEASPIPIAIPQQQAPGQPAFVNPTQAPQTVPVDQPTSPSPVPLQQPQTTPTISQQEATLEQQLTQAKEAEEKAQAGTQEATLAHEKVQQLESQLQDVFLQKQELERQVISLKQQLAQQQQKKVYTPTEAPTEEPKQTAHVIKISKQMSKSVGLPITPDVPNLLTGIIKDPRKNILPNILIEVKDKDGNAVRAFKTNNLGQFASATPLLNGTYTISFEDPQGKHEFDTIEITANGEILSPLEIISVDDREKLRQELFGAGVPATA